MAKKIYNDASDNFSDWTTKKLKQEVISYDELIRGEASCYGMSDLRMESAIIYELESRGVEINNKLTFN